MNNNHSILCVTASGCLESDCEVRNDKSGNKYGVSPVVFSVDYENVYSREYVDDILDYKNCAYTGGQGDGADRTIYIAGNNYSG